MLTVTEGRKAAPECKAKQAVLTPYIDTGALFPFSLGSDLSELKAPARPDVKALGFHDTPAGLVLESSFAKQQPLAVELGKLILRAVVEMPALTAFGIGRNLMRPPAARDRNDYLVNVPAMLDGLLISGICGLGLGRLAELAVSQPIALWGFGAGLLYASVTATWGFVCGCKVGRNEAQARIGQASGKENETVNSST